MQSIQPTTLVLSLVGLIFLGASLIVPAIGVIVVAYVIERASSN